MVLPFIRTSQRKRNPSLPIHPRARASLRFVRIEGTLTAGRSYETRHTGASTAGGSVARGEPSPKEGASLCLAGPAPGRCRPTRSPPLRRAPAPRRPQRPSAPPRDPRGFDSERAPAAEATGPALGRRQAALPTAGVGRRAGGTRAFPGRLCGRAGGRGRRRRAAEKDGLRSRRRRHDGGGGGATHPCRSGSRGARRRATRRTPERVARSPPPRRAAPRRASMLPQPAATLPGSRAARGSGRPPGGAAAALGCGDGCGCGCGGCCGRRHRCGRTLRAGRGGARRGAARRQGRRKRRRGPRRLCPAPPQSFRPSSRALARGAPAVTPGDAPPSFRDAAVSARPPWAANRRPRAHRRRALSSHSPAPRTVLTRALAICCFCRFESYSEKSTLPRSPSIPVPRTVTGEHSPSGLVAHQESDRKVRTQRSPGLLASLCLGSLAKQVPMMQRDCKYLL